MSLDDYELNELENERNEAHRAVLIARRRQRSGDLIERCLLSIEHYVEGHFFECFKLDRQSTYGPPSRYRCPEDGRVRVILVHRRSQRLFSVCQGLIASSEILITLATPEYKSAAFELACRLAEFGELTIRHLQFIKSSSREYYSLRDQRTPNLTVEQWEEWSQELETLRDRNDFFQKLQRKLRQNTSAQPDDQDPSPRTFFAIGDKQIPLPPIAVKLLKALWEKPRRAEEQIVQSVWGHDASEAAVKSACRAIHQAMEAAQAPVRVRRKQGMVWVEHKKK